MGGPGSGPQGFGAGGFHLKPKRTRVATENAITKVNPSEPKRAMFHCHYCSKDISAVVRIKCAVCPDCTLCVECFSVGVEPNPHEASHAYHVIDDLSFPLFTMDWGADEELLLLEAIEIYGLGNWTEVAEHVGTKTKHQCHQHYFDQYVNSPTTPLPDMSKILGPKYVKEEPKEEPKAKKARTDGDGDGADDEANEKADTLASFARPGDERHWGNMPELTGYNVKRNEFDPEYDIEAELPLAEMEFRETDTELDRKLKIRMLEIYNKRLAERIRRKEFIIDRGLLNIKRQQALERKRTPQEKDIQGAVRVFARFLDPDEYEIMLEGFMAESRIRNRIAELKEYRRNGIHTLSEGEVYDAEKRHRMMEIAQIKAVEYPSRGSGGGRANRYLGRDGFVQAPVGDAAPKELQKLTGMERSGSGALTSLGGGARKKAPLPLDLTHLPGVELLSKREKELCVNNRLLPVHYLAIKEALMRASANGQVLKRSEVRHMFKVEPIKAVRVFELLLQNGWVKDPKEETN